MSRKLSTKEILEQNLTDKSPLLSKQVIIWAHNLRSMHNVGSLFRSSDAFGVSEIILSGYTPHPPRAEITKTAIGAEEFVNWTFAEDTNSILERLQRENYTLIGLEQMDDSIHLNDMNLDAHEKLCFILGNEVSGIDNKLIPAIHTFVDIPQYGRKHSLNVSVATGVLLYAVLDKLWAK